MDRYTPWMQSVYLIETIRQVTQNSQLKSLRSGQLSTWIMDILDNGHKTYIVSVDLTNGSFV